MSAEYDIEHVTIDDDPTLRFPCIVFSHEYGAAMVYHDTDQDRLCVDDIEVDRDKRRRGLGEALLRAVKAHAEELQVEQVTATIVSRECLDAMCRVFGVDSVQVRRLGNYAADRSTLAADFEKASALLRYSPSRRGKDF